MKVLFVCTGNTCRSPMCEAYFRRLCEKAGRNDISVSSAGTFAGEGQPASSGSLEIMKRHGIDISGHRSRPLDIEEIRNADIIIALTSAHRMQVGRMLPSALARTHLLLEYIFRKEADVNDPAGGDTCVYDDCFEEMKPALENLLLDIMKNNNNLS
ncbi:MAG: hypothetical protein A2017_19835 [Lentisphaerae bacterium GWF2_44_16]|nr:MAG: hypothetical protein A2017_19835 [Lentisphaerae bacterium GWF2_44_16]